MKKIQISELKVKSFITEESKGLEKIKGGSFEPCLFTVPPYDTQCCIKV